MAGTPVWRLTVPVCVCGGGGWTAHGVPGVPGLGVTGLGVTGVGVTGLGVTGLGVTGLGVSGILQPLAILRRCSLYTRAAHCWHQPTFTPGVGCVRGDHIAVSPAISPTTSSTGHLGRQSHRLSCRRRSLDLKSRSRPRNPARGPYLGLPGAAGPFWRYFRAGRAPTDGESAAKVVFGPVYHVSTFDVILLLLLLF